MLRLSSIRRVMRMREALGQDPAGASCPDKNPPQKPRRSPMSETTTPKRYEEMARELRGLHGMGPLGTLDTQEVPLLADALATAAREAQADERARILKLIDEAMPPLTNNGNAKVRAALKAVQAAIKDL